MATGDNGVITQNGTSDDDTVLGDDVSTFMHGGDGDDYLSGGAGNDTIFGNDGADIAAFSGSILDYSWSEGNGNSWYVSGDDGSDVV